MSTPMCAVNRTLLIVCSPPQGYMSLYKRDLTKEGKHKYIAGARKWHFKVNPHTTGHVTCSASVPTIRLFVLQC